MIFNKKNLILLAFALIIFGLTQCDKGGSFDPDNDQGLVRTGKNIFRFDTFGDEEFWSGLLHIDKAIAGAANGGFGSGISPRAALGVGLKVDAAAIPASLAADIQAGRVNLDDPATTLALLKLNAVVGIKGSFNDNGSLKAIGITCAVCHSTVDNAFSAGIGNRLDGWPNRDLNVGAIISLTDNAKPIADMLHVTEPTLRTVLAGWGPGKFNAVLMVDGKALKPDGSVAANLLPAAFGLKDVALATYTGWGDITYWNSFVANLEMHGKGNFIDPRLNNPVKYPIAVENHFYSVTNFPDLITPKLLALRAYQHSINVPKPPPGSFNASAANRGKNLFMNKAKCATCHSSHALSHVGSILHSADEIGIDNFEASRSPTGKYRTTPLGGLFTRAKGGFYHDGRYANLSDVVNHYNTTLHLNLTTSEKADLVEYLKSL